MSYSPQVEFFDGLDMANRDLEAPVYSGILRLCLADRVYGRVKHCFVLVDNTFYRVDFEIGDGR